MKKQTLYAIAGMVIITLACSFGTMTPAAPTQPQGDQVSTVVAATLQALIQTPTQSLPTENIPTQPSGTSFSFKNVSFVIPTGIAGGANAEVVPAMGEDEGAPWDAGPEHIFIQLSGYPIKNENEALNTMLWVYPAQQFMDANQGALNNVQKLQAILANPSTPINADTAPHVPTFNAAQVIVTQAGLINFQNGSGVRMINHYSQSYSPITQNSQLYHYQGLTSDGKYYMIAVFPIQSPLQSTSANPSADGIAFPDMATGDENAFKTYYQTMTDKLNAADPNSFQPSISQLDALVQSILVSP